jgi:nucleoside-diphosphate-sugar epimerase
MVDSRLTEGIPDLPDTWLITGVAGFIGSHLLEALLGLDRHVVGLDNFATGKRENLADVAARVHPRQWARFQLIEGDVRVPETCAAAVRDAEVVLHQAALNSVPRSLAHPDQVLEVNTIGTTNLFRAAADAGVPSVVYASSSSVYGDVPDARRREPLLGSPMSPYAVSKLAMEQLATVYHRVTGIGMTGLRYFNVFGPRQNPDGPYSAVIPRWIRAMLTEQSPVINGDGTQSRDFTFVDNVVRANLLAAARTRRAPAVLNVGTGHGTSIRMLFETLRKYVAEVPGHDGAGLLDAATALPRQGDVASALADLEHVRAVLDYEPLVDVEAGLRDTVAWFASARQGA